MSTIRIALTALFSLLLVAALVACSDDSGTTPKQDGRTADAKVADKTVADTKPAPDKAADSASPDKGASDKSLADKGKAKQLTSTHKGWKDPLCLACHDGTKAKYPHTSSKYVPTDCVGCHGYNGAPHKGHATKSKDCSGCHSSVKHFKDFKSPDDCVVCHYHP